MANEAKKIPRYYWDACVFLSFVEGRSDRVPTIESLLSDCENGKIEIWSSHLSIAEVAFAKAEKDNKALDPAIEKVIDNLWHPDSPIKLVEVSHLACIIARNFLREAMHKQIGLRSADALHLATAKMIGGVDQFHTYDIKLRKCQPLVTFQVGEPVAEQLLLTAFPAVPIAKDAGQQDSRPNAIPTDPPPLPDQ